MGTVTQTFALAWKHHQANDLARAKQLYLQVLEEDPAHADAWCFLGAVCQSLGNNAEAEAAFRHAIHLVPTFTSALNLLGVALAQQGKLDEAIAAFQQILQYQPADADAHNNVGLVCAQQGRFDEAIACYERALSHRGDFPAARNNLDQAQHQLKASGHSLPRSPVAERANNGEAARAAVNLGVALAQQGRMEEAKTHFEQAAQLQPDNVDAHNDLGGVLIQQQRYDEAVTRFQKVLSLKPDHTEAHYNLAIALHKQGKLDEAIACYQQALRGQPNHLDAQNNLGNLFKEQGKLDIALACYEQALRRHPQHPGTHFNRALAWLLRGDWSEGWKEYEWRWHTDEFPRYVFSQPRWDGAPLAGRTLLVYAEQGLGDTLHFIRYLPLAAQRGGRVIFQCQNPLARLLATAKGIDTLLPRGSPSPAFDLQIPLLSLPGVFRTAIDNVPAAVPYLQPNSRLVEHWQRELAPLRGLKIGIAWQGSPTFRDDRRRSIPLSHFAPLARLPGVHLIILQKGPGMDQLRPFVDSLPDDCRSCVHDLAGRLDEANGAFMDTAAVMKTLDLVISSDTAVPHLAGALAVPVWVALPLAPDWRWLLQREDSPWYPTMRLFRQVRNGQWADVFERLAEEVKVSRVRGSESVVKTPDAGHQTPD